MTYTKFPPEGAVVEVTTYVREKDTLRVSPIGIAGPGTMHRANGFIDAQTYLGPGLAMEWVEVEGPLHETWPTPSHQRLLGDLDFGNATQLDAERVLREFLPRAFRRRVADHELEHDSMLFAAAAKNNEFLAGIKVALQATLCSPHFLYLERLLRDPKATAFNESFTGQWPDLRKITATTPDERLYPEWPENFCLRRNSPNLLRLPSQRHVNRILAYGVTVGA